MFSRNDRLKLEGHATSSDRELNLLVPIRQVKPEGAKTREIHAVRDRVRNEGPHEMIAWHDRVKDEIVFPDGLLLFEIKDPLERKMEKSFGNGVASETSDLSNALSANLSVGSAQI